MKKAIEELNREQFEVVCNLMNDEIREQVNTEVAPCSNRTFIKHYLEYDPDFAQVLDGEFSVDPDFVQVLEPKYYWHIKGFGKEESNNK